MAKQSGATQQTERCWLTPETRSVKQQPLWGSEGLDSCPDGSSPFERTINQIMPNRWASFQMTHSKLPISAHRKGTFTHPHTPHLIFTTVLWHLREYIGLKGRDGLWKPKLPHSLPVFREADSEFSGHHRSWSQIWEAWTKRAKPVFWVTPIKCLHGKDSGFIHFNQIHLLYWKKRNDLFLPGDSYSLARLSYFSILVSLLRAFTGLGRWLCV